MKYIPYLAFAILASLNIACEKIEEQPEIKSGYEKNVRVPDPEEANDEDKAIIQGQKDEYNNNAK